MDAYLACILEQPNVLCNPAYEAIACSVDGTIKAWSSPSTWFMQTAYHISISMFSSMVSLCFAYSQG